MGIIFIVSAILQIYDGATLDGVDNWANLALVIAGIGTLFAAFIYFGFGNKVRKGIISEKIDVLARFVITFGAAAIVANFFGFIGGIFGWISDSETVGVAMGTCLIMMILGFIVVWIGRKINDGKATNFDRIIWIALVVIFLIEFLGNLINIFDSVGWVDILSAILMAVVYLYMLAFLFDGDVRKQMKM